MAEQNIQFFLSICQDRPEVVFMGQKYVAGHRGAIQPNHKIENDILKIDLSDLGHHPQVGGASEIESISIRVCEKNVSTIAIYKDPKKNSAGCCYSDPNTGCSVYGDWGCSC